MCPIWEAGSGGTETAGGAHSRAGRVGRTYGEDRELKARIDLVAFGIETA